MNDNRNYTFSDNSQEVRNEFEIIMDMIPVGAKIIDLGCGNGVLLNKLKKSKSVIGSGVEISPEGVKICQKKGLNVIQGRIDEKMNFQDDAFDYSVCNVTIHMTMYPEILLSEMKRISKFQIISFPNYGFYKNRLEFLLNGNMPRHSLFGYKWYNTGHIHQCSVNDFISLTGEYNLKILDHRFVDPGNPFKKKMMSLFPNLFQLVPVFLLTK
ncbi:MAG: methionine biosynthesis protein MetW [Ignavibacteriaceae bacterium]|nr:methionine biosynthesis protein MetW [Ignavibacteriaceae bacterium]